MAWRIVLPSSVGRTVHDGGQFEAKAVVSACVPYLSILQLSWAQRKKSFGVVSTAGTTGEEDVGGLKAQRRQTICYNPSHLSSHPKQLQATVATQVHDWAQLRVKTNLFSRIEADEFRGNTSIPFRSGLHLNRAMLDHLVARKSQGAAEAESILLFFTKYPIEGGELAASRSSALVIGSPKPHLTRHNLEK